VGERWPGSALPVAVFASKIAPEPPARPAGELVFPAGPVVTRDGLHVVSGYDFTIDQIPGNVLLSMALPVQ
jgi:hypothetical protein